MKLALMFDRDGGEVRVGCELSRDARGIEKSFENLHMTRTWNRDSYVIASEPAVYDRASSLATDRSLHRTGVSRDSDETENRDPWQAKLCF